MLSWRIMEGITLHCWKSEGPNGFQQELNVLSSWTIFVHFHFFSVSFIDSSSSSCLKRVPTGSSGVFHFSGSHLNPCVFIPHRSGREWVCSCNSQWGKRPLSSNTTTKALANFSSLCISEGFSPWWIQHGSQRDRMPLEDAGFFQCWELGRTDIPRVGQLCMKRISTEVNAMWW